MGQEAERDSPSYTMIDENRRPRYLFAACSAVQSNEEKADTEPTLPRRIMKPMGPTRFAESIKKNLTNVVFAQLETCLATEGSRPRLGAVAGNRIHQD